MSCAARQAASERLLQALSRSRNRPRINTRLSQHQSLHGSSVEAATAAASGPKSFLRNASSSSKDSQKQTQPAKGTVLEQPDKFRPPSHGARRNARSTTTMYGGGGAYNQGMTEREREEARLKSYPNMFPAEGTKMYWFLTTRWVHVTLTMVSPRSSCFV